MWYKFDGFLDVIKSDCLLGSIECHFDNHKPDLFLADILEIWDLIKLTLQILSFLFLFFIEKWLISF